MAYKILQTKNQLSRRSQPCWVGWFFPFSISLLYQLGAMGNGWLIIPPHTISHQTFFDTWNSMNVCSTWCRHDIYETTQDFAGTKQRMICTTSGLFAHMVILQDFWREPIMSCSNMEWISLCTIQGASWWWLMWLISGGSAEGPRTGTLSGTQIDGVLSVPTMTSATALKCSKWLLPTKIGISWY